MQASPSRPVGVLFEDPHLLVVNKPGGLPTQADKSGDPSLIDELAKSFPADRSLGSPHRLDRPVSGVVVVTRTAAALAAMNALFASRAITKTYWAIVHGSPPASGMWEHRLVHDARHHKARVTGNADADGEACVVAFRCLAQGDRYALLELVPQGGKFHQLRAQCAAAGHPIKGDVKYGARRGEPDRTISLHARSLVFTHPITDQCLTLEAPTPDTPLWKALLNMSATSSVDPP